MGFAEIVNACGDCAVRLPDADARTHGPTLSETAAKAISNIKFDKIVVWDSGANGSADGKSATSNFLSEPFAVRSPRCCT